jgi:hypothetical protein
MKNETVPKSVGSCDLLSAVLRDSMFVDTTGPGDCVAALLGEWDVMLQASLNHTQARSLSEGRPDASQSHLRRERCGAEPTKQSGSSSVTGRCPSIRIAQSSLPHETQEKDGPRKPATEEWSGDSLCRRLVRRVSLLVPCLRWISCYVGGL